MTELQLGKYEFYPYENKRETTLDDLMDLLTTDKEREKHYRKARKEIEKILKRNQRLKQTEKK